MSFAGPPPAPPPVKIDPTQTHPVLQVKHASPLIGCRFDPSGEYVFAGAQDNAVVRWHLSSGKTAVLKGHKSWVRALAFAAREKLLFSADWAGRIIAWPVAGDAPCAALEHPGPSRLDAGAGGQSRRSNAGVVRQRSPRQAVVDPRRQADPRAGGA